MKENNHAGDAIVRAMFEGYGPKFTYKNLDELMAAAAVVSLGTTSRLHAPFPALGRYHTTTAFLSEVTSGYALGRHRYRLFAEKLIWLARAS